MLSSCTAVGAWLAHFFGGGRDREAAAEDGDQPLVGLGEALLCHVAVLKHALHLQSPHALFASFSHGALLGGPLGAARAQYPAAGGHREIPVRNWRAAAPVGCPPRTLEAVWQYCRRREHPALWRPRFRRIPVALFHITRLQPLGQPRLVYRDVGEQPLVAAPVKARADVTFQHPLR